MYPRFRKFTAETDFHGVRHVSDPSLPGCRRALWVLVLLGSAVSFGFFASSRIQYYLGHPFTTTVTSGREDVVMPAVAICPGAHKVIVTPDTAQYVHLLMTWPGMSDTDFVMMVALKYQANITHTDWNTGKTTLDYNVLQAVKNMSFPTSGTTYGDYNLVQKSLQIRFDRFPYYHPLLVANVLRSIGVRLQRLPSNFSIQFEEELVPWLKKFGVDDTFPLPGEQTAQLVCRFHSGNIMYTCDNTTTSQILTADGYCFVVDGYNLNGTLFAADYGGLNTFQIVLNVSKNPDYTFKILFFDANEILHPHYQSIAFHQDLSQGIMKVNRVIKRKRLGKPYNKKACARGGYRSHCMEDCFMKNLNCSMFFFSKPSSKPPCPAMMQVHSAMGHLLPELLACNAECPMPCEETQYDISVENKDTKKGTFQLDISDTFEVIEYTEEYLYGISALLAELGGTLGLFMGASVLTLYHALEYSLVSILGCRCCSNKQLPVRRHTHNL